AAAVGSYSTTPASDLEKNLEKSSCKNVGSPLRGGVLADSVTTRESINRGKARELRIRSLRCQHPYLRPLSMSYDGSVKCRGSPASTSCDVMSNVIQEISVPRRASRGRRCLHVSHSCLAAFRPRSRTGLQLSVETHVLPFCSSHWSHKSPQNYF